MPKQHFLKFIIHNQTDDLLLEVREAEVDRIRNQINDFNGDTSEVRFHWIETVDGKNIIINMACVQAIRILWDAVEFPSDMTRSQGPIVIALRGATEQLKFHTEEPDQIYDLFTNLEHGPDVVPYPMCNDEDGEPIIINAREVVWVMAPTHIIDEGRQIVIEEDGLGT
jgi:hypothetical protein